jgi:hypothetical protein
MCMFLVPKSHQTVGPVDNHLPPNEKRNFDVSYSFMSLSILIYIRSYAKGYHVFDSSS